MIPKIIHQTAPSDITKWHSSWFEYQKSWKNHFSNYEYKIWTDEDLKNLIQKKYEWFFDTYNDYDINIKRIDAARYFLLYEYGGIYVDMDFECINNFEHEIPENTVSIAETGSLGVCRMENALMISPKKHEFWTIVFDELVKNKNSHVFTATGPILIEKCINIYNNKKNINTNINILDRKKYSLQNKYYAIHHQTGVWLENKPLDEDMEQIFTKKYNNCEWGNNNSKEYSGSSGLGSSLEYNKKYINFINNFIITNNITSIVDLGCGDWRFSSDIFPKLNISYIGYDVYDKLIKYLNKTYSSDKIKFEKLDFYVNKEKIQNADLLLCKDVLQHWSDEYVENFVQWICEHSNFKYILITNCHTGLGDDKISVNGRWYRGLGSDHIIFKKNNFKTIFKYHTKETIILTKK
jgi:hypothetical protein